MPNCNTSVKCVSEFSNIYKIKTGLRYDKSYPDIYKKLSTFGSEIKAIDLSKRKINEHEKNGKNKPSEMYPATTVYQLVEEIKSKINN